MRRPLVPMATMVVALLTSFLGCGASTTSSDAVTAADSAAPADVVADQAIAVAPDSGPSLGAPDGAGPSDSGPPDFCQDHRPSSGDLPGKPAGAFCDEYLRVCGFGGAGRYLDRNDCLALYLAAPPPVQSCRAAYLCFAKAGSPADHCPHAAGQTTLTRCRGP